MELIDNQPKRGGARPGAGRPKGSRDRRTVSAEASAAEVVGRIPLGDLLQVSPDDVLRLAMLLALRRGDIEGAAEHARRLQGAWQPHLSNTEAKRGQQVLVVNRLVRELHDPAAPPGSHQFARCAPAAGPAATG